MKIIKLTERQLRETQGEAYQYIGNNDDSQYNGQSEISADGQLDDEDFGDPLTSDELADELVPNTYNRFNRLYGCGKHLYDLPDDAFDYLREDDDRNNDHVDDFFQQSKQMDTLNNGDDKDNLAVIPQGIDQKLDILLNTMKQEGLSGKQVAMVLNKFIEKIDFNSMPLSWRKELRLKIR